MKSQPNASNSDSGTVKPPILLIYCTRILFAPFAKAFTLSCVLLSKQLTRRCASCKECDGLADGNMYGAQKNISTFESSWLTRTWADVGVLVALVAVAMMLIGAGASFSGIRGGFASLHTIAHLGPDLFVALDSRHVVQRPAHVCM
jgi:hypothetical protein